jgi:hypothetical protein
MYTDCAWDEQWQIATQLDVAVRDPTGGHGSMFIAHGTLQYTESAQVCVDTQAACPRSDSTLCACQLRLGALTARGKCAVHAKG